MSVDLTIAAHPTAQATVVRLSGVLTGEEIGGALERSLPELLSQRMVVFDLRGLQVITARGLRLLDRVTGELQARRVSCRFVVDAATPAAAVLRATALPREVEMFDSVEQALPTTWDTDLTDDPDALPGQFASLTGALLTATTVGTALRHIVDTALVIVPGADLASVTLRDPTGRFFTPVETGPEASELDEVQYRAGEGPCVDAARPDGPAFAMSEDLATEQRWPRFARAATNHGMAAVLSTDLVATDDPTAVGGALNIYSRRPHGLDVRDQQAALLLAGHATLAVAHVQATQLADVQKQNLLRAIETRDVIGQAKGILMARQGLTAEEAFAVLRRTSQQLNVKLVDLARTLAQRPDGLDEPDTRS